MPLVYLGNTLEAVERIEANYLTVDIVRFIKFPKFSEKRQMSPLQNAELHNCPRDLEHHSI